MPQARISRRLRHWKTGRRRYRDHIDIADAFLRRVSAQTGDSTHRLVEAVIAAKPLTHSDEIAHLKSYQRHGDPQDLEAILLPHLWKCLRPLLRKPLYDAHFDDAFQEAVLASIEYLTKLDPDRKQSWVNLISFAPKNAHTSTIITTAAPMLLPSDRGSKRIWNWLDGYGRHMRSLRSSACWESFIEQCPTERDRETARTLSHAVMPLPIDDTSGESHDPTPETDLRLDVERLIEWGRTQLPEREVVILERLHVQVDPDSLADIAADLGLSVERIRQLDKAMMIKLREAWESDLLPPEPVQRKSYRKRVASEVSPAIDAEVSPTEPDSDLQGPDAALDIDLGESGEDKAAPPGPCIDPGADCPNSRQDWLTDLARKALRDSLSNWLKDYLASGAHLALLAGQAPSWAKAVFEERLDEEIKAALQEIGTLQASDEMPAPTAEPTVATR